MFWFILFLECFLFLDGTVATDTITVASLGGHYPTHWKSTCKHGNISTLVKCNLEIYAKAITKASEENAQLIVMPEGYGLIGRPADNDKQHLISLSAVTPLSYEHQSGIIASGFLSSSPNNNKI